LADGPSGVQAYSADGDTIAGAWEKRFGDAGWEHDFDLIYRRVG
jgi:hypothetical protein